MKKVLIAFASVCMLFAASSCKKSVECCYSGTCETVSVDDFNGNKATYDAYVNALKASGYTCK